MLALILSLLCLSGRNKPTKSTIYLRPCCKIQSILAALFILLCIFMMENAKDKQYLQYVYIAKILPICLYICN